jgi:hypothetical protein
MGMEIEAYRTEEDTEGKGEEIRTIGFTLRALSGHYGLGAVG